jgi:SAM-dependent methyltransferase
MGEIFRRESAEHPEPFTGERLTTAIGGQVQIEHYHRYLFARAFVANLDVLDVASGEGYGSALLAQVARSVVGIEYSGETVATAAKNFVRPNLCFLQSDARALPLANASIDIAVSFETIEHLDRQTDFLQEVHRILRPNGRFIVSTPDRDVYSPAGSAANPFHVHELSGIEFTTLLHATFRNVAMLRQRALIGSALLADTALSAPPLVFDRRGDTHFEACIGIPRAPYLIAVASDGELPPLPPSLYISRGDLDTDLVSAMTLAKQVNEAQAQLAQTTAKLEEMTQRAERERVRAERAERERVEAERQRAVAEREHGEVQRELGEVVHARDVAEQRFAALQDSFQILQGSLRTFLRGYLPLLRAHFFGQRP